MEEQRNEYRTGPTAPRPKHTGIIVFLLILVIFLAGLVSVLGIMNIHLFRMLDEKKDATPLSFSQQEDPPPTQTDDTVVFAGMTVQEIPAAYQSVQELPAGLYISHVQDGSAAHQKGILAGDVLVDFAGQQITSLEAFRAKLPEARNAVRLIVNRNGEQKEITLEVSAE